MGGSQSGLTEQKRLAALKEYSILDTQPEEEFDDMTRLASEICNTPISLVSLIDNDRQWFKSRQGINKNNIPRKYAFCSYAIKQPEEIMVVPDAREDDRFKDNPLVKEKPHFIFYAGVPLVNKKGYALGTLCVSDEEPRELTDFQIKALKSLANQVMNLLELRKYKMQLNQNMKELKEKNKNLNQFANLLAHDFKSPVNNITLLVQLFEKNYGDQLSEGMADILHHLKVTSRQLNSMTENILAYSKSTKVLKQNKVNVNLNELIKEVSTLLELNKKCEVNYPTDREVIIKVNKTALKQMLLNLLENSMQWRQEVEHLKVNFSFESTSQYYKLTISDNNEPIPAEIKQQLFDLFDEDQEPFKKSSLNQLSIRYSIVKRLVEKLGGTVNL